MISCLYPDCDYSTKDGGAGVEAAPEAHKRIIIDHINHDHDDAHVIIACHHELREVERFMAKTQPEFLPNGKPNPDSKEVGEQVKSECVRCGQFVVEDADA